MLRMRLTGSRGDSHFDDAVLVGVAARHVFHAQHAAAVKGIGSRHLLEAGFARVDQVVGQVHEERLLAYRRLGAQHRVAEPQRRRLADIDAGGVARQHAADLAQQLGLALGLEQLLEFLVGIEVILDGALGSAGDEHQALRAGGQRLLDRVLDQRLVDHRQHLLRAGLGGRQEARTAPGDREYRCSDFALHRLPSLGCVQEAAL